MTVLRTMMAAALLAFACSPGAAQERLPDASAGEPPAHAHGSHEASPAGPQPDHGEHQQTPARPAYPASIPPITDEDRAAAFPKLNGQHTVHDQAIHYFVLFDQLEWQSGAGPALTWDTKGWVGRDVDRFWFRTEGEGEDGDLEDAEVHALYGRAIARWWDLVAGVRQDIRPGPGRTWAALGIQGLAPYWFEVEATAYIGEGGRTHLRLETEYELLLTNRLILQPLVEADVYGRSDRERAIGAGLSAAEAGLRLRYEIRREVAPYVGVTWHRKFFGTADLAEAVGERTGGARLALGVRVWF